tara:strand:+ start:212 stop:1099 length:888 start_codon:yes stop_codon:yes gene_type:complete
MKTKKNKVFSKSKTKTKKAPYNIYSIHKVTLISYDPIASCKNIKELFGSEVGKIQSPPDKGLKQRGIKWINFVKGGKAEFHFVPPFRLSHDKTLRKMVNEQKKIDPLKTQFFENHVGLYVPDLTPIIKSALEKKRPCHLNRRADGMYQFYIQIDGCLDYLDIDSMVLNTEKLKKLFPDFHIYSFLENTALIKKFTSLTRKKNYIETHKKIYFDPAHNAPREVTILKNKKIIIKGKDRMNSKMWKITGKLDDHNNAILDFSPKGGPKKITAKFQKDKIKFGDGNSWKLVYKIERKK